MSGCLLFSTGRDGGNDPAPPAFSASASGGGACDNALGELRVELTGAVATEVSAALVNEAGESFSVTWLGDAGGGSDALRSDAALKVGSYGLRLRRSADGAEVELGSVLQVRAAPVFAGNVGVCRVGNEAVSVVVSGQRLLGATYAIGGVALVASEKTETGARLQIPASVGPTSGGSVTLRAEDEAGCAAETTLSFGRPAEVTSTAYSPRTKAGAVQAHTRVGVRVDGTFEAGAKLFVESAGGVRTTPQSENNGTGRLEGLFSPGTLPVGEATVRIEQNGCISEALLLTVGEAPVALRAALGIDAGERARLSPSALALVAGRFVDVFARGALGSAVELGIDRDPSAFSDEFVGDSGPMRNGTDVVLDATGTALRLDIAQTTAVTAPPSQSSFKTAVRISGSLGEIIWDEALTLLASDVNEPRIVMKEREWLHAGVADAVRVYGCGLSDPQVSFVLRNEATGDETALGRVGTASPLQSANDTFANATYRCAHSGGGAVGYTTLSTPVGMSAGVYRLRLVRTIDGVVHTHDDLYPLVLYADAPELRGPKNVTSGMYATMFSATSLSGQTLSVARKNPASVVASDAEGRKYLYVLGGTIPVVPSINPAVIDGAEASYEYAAIAPDHTLLPFEQTPSASHALEQRIGAGAVTALAAPYGAALASEGSRLYLAGGTTTGSAASDKVFVSTVQLDAGPGQARGALGVFEQSTPVLFGGNSCAAATGSFGATLLVSRNANTRTLVAMGGAEANAMLAQRDAHDCTTLMSIDADGALSSAATAGPDLPSAQAFAGWLPVHDTSGEATEAWNLGGYGQIDNTDEISLVTASAARATLPLGSTPASLALSVQSASWDFWTAGIVRAGKSTWALGGTFYEMPVVLPRVRKNTLQASDPGALTTLSFTPSAQLLNHTRASYAATHLPPHVYLHGGLRCRLVDDVCTGGTPVVLATDSEHGEFVP